MLVKSGPQILLFVRHGTIALIVRICVAHLKLTMQNMQNTRAKPYRQSNTPGTPNSKQEHTPAQGAELRT